MASPKVFFFSDIHFGHKNLVQQLRKFQDEFYHDEHIIEQWNKKVLSPKDIIYILGDITMEKINSYPQLDRLRGIKHVVSGNHDLRQHCRELLKYVDSISGMIDYKGFILTHCPIHESIVHESRGNIHGHIHGNHILLSNGERDPRYLNVCAEVINYTPITMEELLAKYGRA